MAVRCSGASVMTAGSGGSGSPRRGGPWRRRLPLVTRMELRRFSSPRWLLGRRKIRGAGSFYDLGFLHLYGLSDFRQIPVTSFTYLVKRVCRLHPNSDRADLGLKRKV